MTRSHREPTPTMKVLADLRELLADVPMPSLTRHWVDENLKCLDEDLGGALSREEADDLLAELRDMEWNLSRISRLVEDY